MSSEALEIRETTKNEPLGKALHDLQAGFFEVVENTFNEEFLNTNKLSGSEIVSVIFTALSQISADTILTFANDNKADIEDLLTFLGKAIALKLQTVTPSVSH